MVPVWLPPELGEKVTVTDCGLPPADTAKLEGLTEKTLLLLETFETLRVALPVFETVNVRWLLVPTFTVPKESDVVDKAIVGATPVVVKLTIDPFCIPALFCPTTRK